MMRNGKWTANRVFSIIFLSILLLYGAGKLVVGGINFVLVQTGGIQQRQYTLANFQPVGLTIVDEKNLVNETDDPQLIMNDVQTPLKNIWLKATFSQDPGEVVLFYTTKVGEPYSIKKMVHAEYLDGYYYFVMPASQIQSLRIDTGMFPSMQVCISEITFNRFSSPVQFFALSGEKVFIVAMVALFVASLAALSMAFLKKGGWAVCFISEICKKKK